MKTIKILSPDCNHHSFRQWCFLFLHNKIWCTTSKWEVYWQLYSSARFTRRVSPDLVLRFCSIKQWKEIVHQSLTRRRKEESFKPMISSYTSSSTSDRVQSFTKLFLFFCDFSFFQFLDTAFFHFRVSFDFTEPFLLFSNFDTLCLFFFFFQRIPSPLKCERTHRIESSRGSSYWNIVEACSAGKYITGFHGVNWMLAQ